MKDIFLIDVDDTLLDFHGASNVALIEAFEKCHLTWQEQYAVEFKKCNDGLWEALERKELTRKELIEKRFPLYLSLLGIENAETIGTAFNEYYLLSLSKSPKYMDGAEVFLQRLKKLGKIYVVTNGTAWIQKSRFERSRLWNYIDDAFISQEIGADKPAKAYTNYVLSHIPNFTKERALLIGDSLSADIKMANDSNITSVWFNPENKRAKSTVLPDYTAQNFTEILKIIQNLNAE